MFDGDTERDDSASRRQSIRVTRGQVPTLWVAGDTERSSEWRFPSCSLATCHPPLFSFLFHPVLSALCPVPCALFSQICSVCLRGDGISPSFSSFSVVVRCFGRYIVFISLFLVELSTPLIPCLDTRRRIHVTSHHIISRNNAARHIPPGQVGDFHVIPIIVLFLSVEGVPTCLSVSGKGTNNNNNGWHGRKQTRTGIPRDTHIEATIRNEASGRVGSPSRVRRTANGIRDSAGRVPVLFSLSLFAGGSMTIAS